jgi:hypothetical protein
LVLLSLDPIHIRLGKPDSDGHCRAEGICPVVFDVDKHPVKAIGIVSAALVMIGSLIWSVVLATI